MNGSYLLLVLFMIVLNNRGIFLLFLCRGLFLGTSDSFKGKFIFEYLIVVRDHLWNV